MRRSGSRFCTNCGASFPEPRSPATTEGEGIQDEASVPIAVAASAPSIEDPDPEAPPPRPPDPLTAHAMPSAPQGVVDPLDDLGGGDRGSRRPSSLVVGLAVVTVFSLSLAAFLLFRSRSAEEVVAQPTLPTQVPATSAPPPDEPPDGAQSVDITRMMPPGAKVRFERYPDLDGDGVEDIAAVATRPTGAEAPQAYPRAWIWHEGAWRTVFNALIDRPNLAGAPSEFLPLATGPKAQEIEALESMDLATTGGDELILVAREVGGAEDSHVWILSFDDRQLDVELYAEVAGDVELGNELRLRGAIVTSTDPGCCSGDQDYVVQADGSGLELVPAAG